MGFNFGFFGSSEHRVFNYKPRYYNEEKEALKDKFGHVDGTKEKEPYTPGSYIKGSLRDGNVFMQIGTGVCVRDQISTCVSGTAMRSTNSARAARAMCLAHSVA